MRVIEKGELREYADRIGHDEYQRQYRILYQEAKKQPDKRYSKDRKKTVDLERIREKYRNGITPEILDEWDKDLIGFWGNAE